jgi:uncharacterized protein YaiI (UPF0178 family)
MLNLYVDADACPVKPEVCKVAQRYRLKVTFVANTRMRLPALETAQLVIVGGDIDAADDWIATHVEPGDIVITGDIPLASRCVKGGAQVLDPNGRIYSDDNIGHALATRDLLAELRESGQLAGGPPPFQPRDRSRFLQNLDTVVQQLRRQPGF